jgi:hypothetical protein
MAEPETSHAVLPAGSHPRGVVRWGYFLVLNAIAGVIAVAIFAGVLYADALDPYLRGTYDWLLAHPGATSAIAFSLWRARSWWGGAMPSGHAVATPPLRSGGARRATMPSKTTASVSRRQS